MYIQFQFLTLILHAGTWNVKALSDRQRKLEEQQMEKQAKEQRKQLKLQTIENERILTKQRKDAKLR